MSRWCHKLLFLLLQLIFFTVSSERDIQCHDPDAGGTTLNKDRKFVVYSTQRDKSTGMGNLLIFFPAAYYFAAITGRDLLIEDKSIIGEIPPN